MSHPLVSERLSRRLLCGARQGGTGWGGSVLVQVRGPVFRFQREVLEAFSQRFMLRDLLLLLLLLSEREAGGEAAGRRALIGCWPNRRLQHLHGVAPLAGRYCHLIEGRAGIGHGVGVGRVLPRSLRRPCFSFALLQWKDKTSRVN